jgi:hypothetical protein
MGKVLIFISIFLVSFSIYAKPLKINGKLKAVVLGDGITVLNYMEIAKKEVVLNTINGKDYFSITNEKGEFSFILSDIDIYFSIAFLERNKNIANEDPRLSFFEIRETPDTLEIDLHFSYFAYSEQFKNPVGAITVEQSKNIDYQELPKHPYYYHKLENNQLELYSPYTGEIWGSPKYFYKIEDSNLLCKMRLDEIKLLQFSWENSNYYYKNKPKNETDKYIANEITNRIKSELFDIELEKEFISFYTINFLNNTKHRINFQPKKQYKSFLTSIETELLFRYKLHNKSQDTVKAQLIGKNEKILFSPNTPLIEIGSGETKILSEFIISLFNPVNIYYNRELAESGSFIFEEIRIIHNDKESIIKPVWRGSNDMMLKIWSAEYDGNKIPNKPKFNSFWWFRMF